MPTDNEIRLIIAKDGLSDWFKTALKSALECDPVAAAHDAGVLSLVLDQRAHEITATALTAQAIADAQAK